MAIVKFVASGCPMNNIFPYVMNREKTDENLISGINCSPDTVLQEFMFVKKQFKKEDGRTYVHIVQAFSPNDDLSPEVAHEIGLRFAEYFGGFQALVATHRNTDHIHNHIILNSVNMETGKKFHQSAAEMRQVKEYSNRLCREYGDRVVFMMVNLTDGRRDTVDGTKKFVSEKGYTFPVYFDTGLSGAKAYSVSSIPQTTFIDANGNVFATRIGAMNETVLRSYINAILGG